jgi:hypothetical protein
MENPTLEDSLPLNRTLSELLAAARQTIQHYDGSAWSKCVDYLSENIHTLGIPQAGASEVLRFLSLPQGTTLRALLSPQQAASLVHVIYLWMVEIFGPSPADELLETAVVRVEALPAAAAFSPRSLLH